MFRRALLSMVAVALLTSPAAGADLVRGVRSKISAGDLLSATAAVEDYRRATGVDTEYLEAVGWLARGALMLDRPDLASAHVRELRREIGEETPDRVVALGAAIEVEGKLIAGTEGRGAAIRFFDVELARAKAAALRSRINKNINLLTLEGQKAPTLANAPHHDASASRAGRPQLLFFFAHWCGDCSAQASSLARIWERYRAQGLDLMAVTRHYGTGAGGKEVSAAEETAHIATTWKETYPGLEDVPVVIDLEGMIRYGVSATPTFVLVDGEGVVRLYTPTRLSEAELIRRIDQVLAE